MKIFTKPLLAVLTLLFNFNLNAAVLTVSNNPQIPAQYSDAQAAYNAASDGDVLYLHGSAGQYFLAFGHQTDGVGGTVTSKKVRVVGPGFNPTGQNTLPAYFHFYVYPASETAMDNISIEGVYINNPCLIHNTDFNGQGNFAVNNLQLSRCIYNGTYLAYNFDVFSTGLNPSVQIVQSLFGSANYYVSLPKGLSVFNCIVYAHAQSFTNAYIKNCTFYLPYNTCSVSSLAGFTGTVVENCIFKTATPDCYPGGVAFGSVATVYNNCLFDGAQSNFSADNAFNNCLFQISPGFVDDTDVDGTTYPSFLNSIDLRLAAGSAALTAGAGNTAIGITGGPFPFTNPRTQGRTTLPQMNTLTISATSVPQNGSINVTFQAEKQD
jgi:hypothetical protein